MLHATTQQRPRPKKSALGILSCLLPTETSVTEQLDRVLGQRLNALDRNNPRIIP